MQLPLVPALAGGFGLALLAGCDIPVSRDVLGTEPVDVGPYHCVLTRYREHLQGGRQDTRSGIECVGVPFFCQENGQETDAQCARRFATRLGRGYDY